MFEFIFWILIRSYKVKYYDVNEMDSVLSKRKTLLLCSDLKKHGRGRIVSI